MSVRDLLRESSFGTGKESSLNNGKLVAVFGGSRRDENTVLWHEAYDLGRTLALAGHTVLTGGYGGSMAAASRGATEAGGHVIGVTCAIFDPLLPNRWLAEEIKAPDMLARLRILMERSDAFVSLRGGIGTLAEVTLAWSLVQTRTFVKSLVLLGTDWQPVVEALCAHTDLGDSIAALARIVATPAEVVAVLAESNAPTPSSPPPLG
jgi:uncharacterized protein (TIGR00730 family)